MCFGYFPLLLNNFPHFFPLYFQGEKAFYPQSGPLHSGSWINSDIPCLADEQRSTADRVQTAYLLRTPITVQISNELGVHTLYLCRLPQIPLPSLCLWHTGEKASNKLFCICSSEAAIFLFSPASLSPYIHRCPGIWLRWVLASLGWAGCPHSEQAPSHSQCVPSSWSPSALWLQHEPVWWGCPMVPLAQLLVQLGWETSLMTQSAHRGVSSWPRHHWDGPQKLPTKMWFEYGSWGCPERTERWGVRGVRGRAPWCSPAAEACHEIVVPMVKRLPWWRGGTASDLLTQKWPHWICKCLTAFCPCADCVSPDRLNANIYILTLQIPFLLTQE